MELKDYKDEELAKLYSNTLQLYDDQLSVMEAIIIKTAESRALLTEVEQMMINRGFSFDDTEEEINAEPE
jgi:hypothetical protein